MERPGEKLRQARERLKLTYRDVAEASQEIARRRNSEEFAVALSRLADIENKGTLPTIYRLYTLCAIYRLDWKEVLRWYGVPLELLPSDALQIRLDETHAVAFRGRRPATVPQPLDREIDLNKTTFLSQLIRRWGKMPLSFLGGLEQRHLQLRIRRPGGLVHVPDSPAGIAAADRSKPAQDSGRRVDQRIRPADLFSGTSRRIPRRLVRHRGGHVCCSNRIRPRNKRRRFSTARISTWWAR